MIDKSNLKVIAYKDLKTMLPAGNKLAALYEKSKNKTQFDENLFAVHEGDITTEVLNLHDNIYWDTYYKYVNEMEDMVLFQPVVLGNVHCKVLSFSEGLIAGNVETQNMWARYPDRTDNLAQITGSLNVKEVFFMEGKSMKKSTCLVVLGAATVHTLINVSAGEIKNTKLSIQKEFSFPVIYASEDRGKHALKAMDWSNYTLEELTTHFNKELLDMESYQQFNVDHFFSVGTKLSKEYHNYLAGK